MNLSVTGGTGYLGSAVTAGLLADGRTVRAHVRSTASADRLPAGAGHVAGDLGDAAWLRASIDEPEALFMPPHPATRPAGPLTPPSSTSALCALAGSDRPLVYTGGTWVHGSRDPITEESPVSPPPMVARRPAILQRLQTAAADGIRTVVIAPADVRGAGAGKSPRCFAALPPPAAASRRCCTSATANSASASDARRLRNYLAAVSRRHDESLAAQPTIGRLPERPCSFESVPQHEPMVIG
jgi:nucleoside-diphosphate-sugar epimerase